MENSFYNMELRQFMKLFTDEQQLALGDDFCIVDVRYDRKLLEFKTPTRLDAFLILFCISGKVRLSVNMKEFTMEKDQVALLIPGFIGQVVNVGEAEREDIHYVLVGVTRRYLSTLHLDLNRIFSEGTALLDSPCVRLSPEEKTIATRYLDLASAVLASEVPNKRDCIGSLISSLLYLSQGVFNARLDRARREPVARSGRADEVLNRFLHLLADYHTRARNVAFYADKLCLSPKYFSKLIKTASGRSAPEWIDTYVVLEAQNYMKYSGLSIKEIVFRLNFSVQPALNKFFKSHTAMTPAQFRKS